MDHPSPEDRQYFQRVAAAIPRLEDSRAPESLAETLDRMEDMERRLRGFGRADARGPDHGDLESHLAFLARLRAVDPSYHTR